MANESGYFFAQIFRAQGIVTNAAIGFHAEMMKSFHILSATLADVTLEPLVLLNQDKKVVWVCCTTC